MGQGLKYFFLSLFLKFEVVLTIFYAIHQLDDSGPNPSPSTESNDHGGVGQPLTMWLKVNCCNDDIAAHFLCAQMCHSRVTP